MFIAVFSTTIGAISGMGGGIIIKPMMDAVVNLETAAINFMSACTVLAMAVVSIYRGRKDEVQIDYSISAALALGASVGGVWGKILFQQLSGNVALLQSVILFVLNVGIYFYVKFRHKITMLQVKNLGICALIGIGLGTCSSFLGIGGGPINIAVLQFFFSSSAKVTAKRSIFVILMSQVTSVGTVLLDSIPAEVTLIPLVLMMIGGCVGAIVGGKVAKKFTEAQMNEFFVDVLVGIIVLNAYNIGALTG